MIVRVNNLDTILTAPYVLIDDHATAPSWPTYEAVGRGAGVPAVAQVLLRGLQRHSCTWRGSSVNGG